MKHMSKATGDIMKSRKPRPGATGDPVLVRIQPDLAAQLDNWRRHQQDLPSRPEAIRRLLETALKAAIGKSLRRS